MCISTFSCVHTPFVHVMMRHLTVFPLIIQPGSKFPDHVNISRILVWKSNRQLQKHIMDLFEVIKCSTQVPTVHYVHNFKGITYKSESPDSPALLNCFPINICSTVLPA